MTPQQQAPSKAVDIRDAIGAAKKQVMEVLNKQGNQQNQQPDEASTPRNVFENENTPGKKNFFRNGQLPVGLALHEQANGLIRQPSAPVIGAPFRPVSAAPGGAIVKNNAVNQEKRYVEEQYSKYVKDIGQLLEGAEDASDALVLRRDHHHHGNKESPMTARENDGNDDELRGSSSSSSQESSFPDQADREDDEDEE